MALSKWTQDLIANNFEVSDTLKAVAQASTEYKALQSQVEQVEEQLKQLKADAETLGSYVVPELLSRAGLKKFSLEDGTEVSCKEQVFCSLPKTDPVARDKALDWLNTNGGGSLIKDTLVVESPTEALVESLKGQYRLERKRDVNAMSLKSFMSELLGIKKNTVAQVEPDEVPPELHLFIKNQTTIKE